MEINMTEIVALLEAYHPDYTPSESADEFIRDVVLADGCIKRINPNLLYLCDIEHYQEILMMNTTGNILLVCQKMESIKKAAMNRFNLIQVPSSENPELIYNTIYEYFLKRREFTEKKTKLVDALLSCQGVQHIIDVGYAVIKNPMFASDLGYNVLAFNKNAKVVDPSWPTAEPEEEFESYERIKKLNDSGVFERLYKSDVPCIENFDYSPTRWMAHKIKIYEKNIGHIAVVESEKAFEDMDLELLQFLCEIVASELQKDTIRLGQYDNEFEHFITDLLDEKITKYESIEKRGKSLKLYTKKNLFVMTICPGDQMGKGMSLSYIKTFINRLLNTEKSILYHNKIIFLMQRDKKEVFSGDPEKKLQEFLTSNELNAGISHCFHGVANFKKNYLQAIKAIELGSAINETNRFYYYQDYAVYHLLESAEAQSDIMNFCSPHLFDLMAYDRQYNTDYCHNLYIYLLNDGNITRTSQIFEIHRNSMKYRIKKIEEILSISLEDSEIKFSLFMSFKIMSYVGDNKFQMELFKNGN